MGLKEQLALDVVQFALDLVGILDPTGTADSMSGLISLGRGKWLDAAISGVSVMPYIGDIAKTAKLPRYARSIREAVALAARDAEFATVLRPALLRVNTALDKLPASQVPVSARSHLQEIQTVIGGFLQRGDSQIIRNGGFGRIKFVGLIGARPLRDVTQQSVRSALAKLGIREAHNAHFISRLVQRGPEFGIHTLDDLASAMNNGMKRVGSSPGTVEIVAPSRTFAVVVNSANELVTFLPLR